MKLVINHKKVSKWVRSIPECPNMDGDYKTNIVYIWCARKCKWIGSDKCLDTHSFVMEDTPYFPIVCCHLLKLPIY